MVKSYSTMKRSGRPYHNFYSKLGFFPVKVGNRNCAKCNQCGQLTTNTGIARLQAHRRYCTKIIVKEHRKRLQRKVTSDAKAIPILHLVPNIPASEAEPSIHYHRKANGQIKQEVEETEGAQTQQKQKEHNDNSVKESSKTRKANDESVGEKQRTCALNKDTPFFHAAAPRSYNGVEGTGTREENSSSSQNRYPAPSENQEREQIGQKRLPQQSPENVLNPTKVNSEGDPDLHFLLSLLPHFKSIPEHLKFDAHFDIMAVIKKYKSAGQTPSSYYPHEYNPPQNNFIDELQQTNPSSYTESFHQQQTSTHCAVTPTKEESIDCSTEFSSGVAGYEDTKYQMTNL